MEFKQECLEYAGLKTLPSEWDGKTPFKNAIAYGAGGGGGGFRQVGTSGMYYWTAGGDGMQGCVIIEVV